MCPVFGRLGSSGASMMDVGCCALTYGGTPTAIVYATMPTANQRLQLPVIVIKNLLVVETDSAGLPRPSKGVMSMLGEHQRPRRHMPTRSTSVCLRRLQTLQDESFPPRFAVTARRYSQPPPHQRGGSTQPWVCSPLAPLVSEGVRWCTAVAARQAHHESIGHPRSKGCKKGAGTP